MCSNEPLVNFFNFYCFRKLQPSEILQRYSDSKENVIKILTRGSMDITLNFNHVKSYSICFKTAEALGKLLGACQYFLYADLEVSNIVITVTVDLGD